MLEHTSHIRLMEGRAERLPIRDASVDILLNVESSHLYADMDAFLREVFRVLKPGGYFCWADLRDSALVTLFRFAFPIRIAF